MKTYTHTFECKDMISPVFSEWDFYPYNKYSHSNMCFFDIETTGLSAAASSIYLIGAGHYEEDRFVVIQWFADDYESEKDILNAFLTHIAAYKVLLQYNGNTFDLPYVKSKCRTYRIPCDILGTLVHIDLYSSLRRYSGLLNLPNKKLISFEQYVGLNRDDKYNGGELIQVYSEYMQNKYLKKDNDDLLHMLLLHNYEDITGLSQVASLMFLKELDKLNLDVISCGVSSDTMTIIYKCDMPAAYSFSLDIPCISDDNGDCMAYINCRWGNKCIELVVPIINYTFNYYFADYKDYYYMINEGTIMHKSVAIYTDSSVRRKAKKAECFVTNTGKYIPIKKHGCYSADMHIFRKDYTSKEYFIEYDESFTDDSEWLIRYYRQLF